MAMGLSTQSSSFRPSFCPPYFWRCHSCSRTSSSSSSPSQSFWASSKTALGRLEVCNVQSASGPFSRVGTLSKQCASYSSMQFGEVPWYDNVECVYPSPRLKPAVYKVRKRTSYSQMLPSHRSGGKFISRGSSHLQKLVENQQSGRPLCSQKDYESIWPDSCRISNHCKWNEETEKLRESRLVGRVCDENTAVDFKISPGEARMRHEQANLDYLKDGSDYKNDELGSAYNSAIDSIVSKKAPQNLYNREHMNVGQMLHAARSPYGHGIREQTSAARNGGKVWSVAEDPASVATPSSGIVLRCKNDDVVKSDITFEPGYLNNMNQSSNHFSRYRSLSSSQNRAQRSSSGLEQTVFEQSNLGSSRPPHQQSGQEEKVSGKGHYINNGSSVPRLQASIEQKKRIMDDVDVWASNLPRGNNLLQRDLSLTKAQPSGSVLVKHSDDHKETNLRLNGRSATGEIQNGIAVSESSAIDNVNETYIVPLTSDETLEASDYALSERLGRIYDKVLLVDNISVAKDVAGMLTNQYRHLIHACDTEVSNIDVKLETPVDHGEIICFSIYSGPGADFGNGKTCIWVDILDGGRNLLAEFAPFFEDPTIKKVWHNYSFDHHILENYGLKVSGFHADTMHMARLWDSSRRTEGGYSLEALSRDPLVMSNSSGFDADLYGKVSMKTIFGKRKLKKDGSEGKVITIPPVEELQRNERKQWICYSALDSISTLNLYESLKYKLSAMNWLVHGSKVKGKMIKFYEEYWRPFGELLVNLESEGMLVDRGHLSDIEEVAKAEQQVAADRFRNWASKYCPDAKYMNVGSDAQLRQLFFGGIQNRKNPDESLPMEKDFKVPNVDKVIEEGKKVPTKYRKIKLRSLGVDIVTDIYTASGWPSVSGDALKNLAGKVSSDFEFVDDVDPLQSDENTEELPETSELPEMDQASNGGLDISAYGTAYTAFGGGKKAIEACHAIAALCDVCSIDSLISNFILPLQGGHISGKNGRIHCSLNINTETGRLSARRPNLQNQPALEKDRYKIRQAFIAAPGNSLIVADYGQLELRILAHLANCKSMLHAFKAGGDFHSRTAMNMYPHIREAITQNHVLLEWHPQPGEDKPPVPLLKDAFASERRKAKMLNFSIAYGKTAVGLARDWKVSVKEAKETVDLWYSDRKEVLDWQECRKAEARKDGRVHTILGRARTFPSMKFATPAQKGHIERAAINTPVQGSAADVAMCAMLEISKNVCLKDLGWRLLLQVHDEVILEGPTESAEEAKAIVIQCMAKPFNGENILNVDLSVDAKCAQSWYAAK